VGATSLFESVRTVDLPMDETQEVSEACLVAAAKRGQQAAFGKLFERHSKKVFHTTLRVTRSREDAEDALQESFLSAFTHLESFDGRSSFATWLTRIAINAALMKLRKNRNSREIPMDESDGTRDTLPRFEPVDWHPDPEENYALQERRRVVSGAVRALRPALRKVIEIGELQELSLKETAQRLSISVAAVKGRLFHAKAALRRSPRLKVTRQARVGRGAWGKCSRSGGHQRTLSFGVS
jgi:RNA polymerase sigma factor (sigma-70 family)